MRSQGIATALPRGRTAIGELRDSGYLAHLTFALAELASALIEFNERAEAATVLDERLAAI